MLVFFGVTINNLYINMQVIQPLILKDIKLEDNKCTLTKPSFILI